MNRHYTHCEKPDCIVCKNYTEQRKRDALYRLIEWRQRGPGQEALTSYE